MRKRNEKKGEVVRALAMITQIGLAMMTSMTISLFLGWWLDRIFNTKFIVIIMLFVGMAAAVKSMLTVTKSFTKNDKKTEDNAIGNRKKKSD